MGSGENCHKLIVRDYRTSKQDMGGISGNYQGGLRSRNLAYESNQRVECRYLGYIKGKIELKFTDKIFTHTGYLVNIIDI